MQRIALDQTDLVGVAVAPGTEVFCGDPVWGEQSERDSPDLDHGMNRESSRYR